MVSGPKNYTSSISTRAVTDPAVTSVYELKRVMGHQQRSRSKKEYLFVGC
jgi:hypothetical protein